MTKHRTKRPISDPSISALTPGSTRQMLLRKAVLDTRIALREFLLAAGMKVLLEELEDDRTLLCGPRGNFKTTAGPTGTDTTPASWSWAAGRCAC